MAPFLATHTCLRYQASMLIFLLFCIIRLATADSHGKSNSGFCRCATTQPCFPGTAALQAFNVSVGGRLIVPHPTAYSCYPGEGYDQAECTELNNRTADGLFRSTIPGGMQTWNLEEAGDERCELVKANTAGAHCHQGNVPHYGVAAESVADVQATVKFAVAHNLRLFIKTTGHDHLGRSAAHGSFMLWLHKLKSQVISQSFTPTGCSHTAAVGPVVTISGGPQFWDVYAAISNQTNDRYVLIGGFCPSVGAAGGFALGGGHGALSPTYGLAVDNVLQYEVVNAEGELKIVNQCTDPDLFWALKGGGGGTFGVMTSVTYQLQPSPPNLSSFEIKVTPVPGTFLTDIQMQQLMTTFFRQADLIDSARWGGYVLINKRVGFAATFLVPLTVAAAEATVRPFMAAWAPAVVLGLATIHHTLTPQISFWHWRKEQIMKGTKYDDGTIPRGTIGTRLIPLDDVLAEPDKAGKAVGQAAFMADNFIGYVTAGQGVRERDNTSQATSVHPAWRKAFMQAELQYLWEYNTPQAGIDAKMASLNAALTIWRQAWPNSPNSGVYFNEAALEPNWQEAYWGTNYGRLLSIKKRVDPNDVFMCAQCVGSESWDASGNCKV